MDENILTLIGGSALLIYSMDQLSRNIQFLAGSRFKAWINAVAGNRFAGGVLGVLLSAVMASSGAVTVLLVGLANARLLPLTQIMAVTLGAAVGSTVIVQLVAFNISQYALLLIATGVFTGALSKSDDHEKIARSVLYLGLLFFSMNLLTKAGVGLEDNELFSYILSYFKDRPVASFLISFVFTALIHSSAATVAFVMSLMAVREATLMEAIPWVLGANLGTTTTAFIASIRGGPHGKQAALAHLLVKAAGVVVILPFLGILGDIAMTLTTDLSRQIAHTHTLFNIFVAVAFFPLIGLGCEAVKYFIPDKDEAGPFHMKYLDSRSLGTPELALAQAQQEIMRVAEGVEKMVEESLALFKSKDSKKIDAVRESDRLVDFLNKGVKLFLTKLSQREMSPEQVHRELELLFRTNDLESMGDIVDKEILSLVKKTVKKSYSFSNEGWDELCQLHAKVIESLKLSNMCFVSDDAGLIAKLVDLQAEIDDMVYEFNERHVQRLHDGVQVSVQSTSVHLDLTGQFHRIAKLSAQFVKTRDMGRAIR